MIIYYYVIIILCFLAFELLAHCLERSGNTLTDFCYDIGVLLVLRFLFSFPFGVIKKAGAQAKLAVVPFKNVKVLATLTTCPELLVVCKL